MFDEDISCSSRDLVPLPLGHQTRTELFPRNNRVFFCRCKMCFHDYGRKGNVERMTWSTGSFFIV